MQETSSSTIMRPESIEKRARQILEEHGLYSVPVDPVIVARRLGITVNNAVFAEQNLSGMVARRGNRSLILVNANEHPFRKRFTIAHEIGHLVLHLGHDEELVDHVDSFREAEPEQDDGWTPERRREYEANRFAAALLMDADLLQREWSQGLSVEELARRFRVSEIAVSYRLHRLGLLR